MKILSTVNTYSHTHHECSAWTKCSETCRCCVLAATSNRRSAPKCAVMAWTVIHRTE